MQISLEAAERIGNMTVFGFGFGLVFVGLICIIFICSLVGFLCKTFIKDTDDKKTVSAPMASASAPAQGVIPDKGAFVAAVSAAIAEDLGTDVTGIRVLSIKKL